MCTWFERLWAKMTQMPGPVWVFGAWAVARFAKWLVYAMPGWLYVPNPMDWVYVLGVVGMIVGLLLPLILLWMLLCKKPFAVSLTSLYIGLKGALMFLAIITTTIHSFNPPIEGLDFSWMESGPKMVAGFLVCTAFLVYLERDETVARTFPGEQNRRLPWWVYVVGLVLMVGGCI